MGTYDEIAKAHRDLTAPPTSPSGHRNKYGGVKWSFPADVHIDFNSWIQKALLAQVSWDDPLVRMELHELLNKDKEEIMEFIEEQREHVIDQIKELWPVVVQLEKAAFAANEDKGNPDCSFFTNEGRHPEREGDWFRWDHDYSSGDAVDRLIDEIDMEPDVRYYFRENQGMPMMPNPSSPFKTPRSRSGTLSSQDGSVRSTESSPPPVPPIPPKFAAQAPPPSAPVAGPSTTPRRSERTKK